MTSQTSQRDTRPASIRIADDINALLAPTHTVEHTTTLRALPGTYPLPRGQAPAADRWERVDVTHTVTGPSLLEQVAAAVTGRTMNWDDTFRSVPQSKPSASLEAIYALQRVAGESQLWARMLGAPNRSPLPDRLRGIVGQAATAPVQLLVGDDQDRTIPKGGLARAARGWLVTAKVVTGWERPTWAPNVPCPNVECERRGTIRIRLEQGVGVCTACGTFWDTDSIGRLGDYVRWASEHLAGTRHWLYDADGYPVECTECLTTRQEMAGRQGVRIREAKAATRPARATA